MQKRRPIIRHLEDLPSLAVPCGESRRLITRADTPHLGVHVTHITAGELHHHNRTEEVYYVLSGSGVLELDGVEQPVKPGTAVLIAPGTRHRGRGDFTTMIITSPAFDPEDEVLD